MGPLLIPALQAGLAIGGQVASMVPGPYQKYSKDRLKEIKGDVAAGRGLSAAEANTMANTGMAPVRAMAGSMASELARVQAAGGGVGGGAVLAGARDQMANTLGAQAEKVGARVAAANQDMLAAKRQEIDDRLGVQGERRAAMASGLVNTLSSTLGQFGEMAGAPPGTFNLSGDIEQQAAARRDARSAGQAAGAPAPVGARPGAESLRMAALTTLRSNPQATAALRSRFASYPDLQRQFTALIERGVPLSQAMRAVGVTLAAQPAAPAAQGGMYAGEAPFQWEG